MDFLVTRSTEGGSFITPSGQTPSGVLDLSVIDSIAVLRCNARTLHVFKGGNASVIREAFGKALVPYYPLAGRLKLSQQNNQLLQIDCSAQGIWFVEASADCTLLDVNYFDEASALDDSIFDKLLPQLIHSSTPLPAGHDSFMDPLVLVQVTEFKCGGYVMGLTFCHSICDGLGAAQFLKAVGEFARGVEKLSVTPVWCREYLLPSPSTQKEFADRETKDNSSMPPPLAIPLPDQPLEHASFDIPTDEINQLKHQVMQELIMDQNVFCSSFEIIAATLWRNRTRATLNLTDDNKNPSSSSSNTSIITVGIVSKQPLPENGIRLMTWCVRSHHLPSFLTMMNRRS